MTPEVTWTKVNADNPGFTNNVDFWIHNMAYIILSVSLKCSAIQLKEPKVMVFNATFNNISVMLWWSVLLVEETAVPGDNHRPIASSSTPRHDRDSNSQLLW